MTDPIEKIADETVVWIKYENKNVKLKVYDLDEPYRTLLLEAEATKAEVAELKRELLIANKRIKELEDMYTCQDYLL